MGEIKTFHTENTTLTLLTASRSVRKVKQSPYRPGVAQKVPGS
jgi:hypothetical protein